MTIIENGVLKVGVYIYYVALDPNPFSITGPSPTTSVLIFNPHKKIELWRYFTYMFIHIGWLCFLFWPQIFNPESL